MFVALVIGVIGIDLAGPFTGPVNQPDVVGGWSSTRVTIRVAPGVTPVPLATGGWRLDGAADAVLPAIDIAPSLTIPAARAPLASRHALDRYYRVEVAPGTDTPALAAWLRTLAGVERAEPEPLGGIFTTPSDALFGQQYALHNTGQTINGVVGLPDADIDAPEAWDLHTGSPDTIVAIIDTGISLSHPDLNTKFVPGWNTIDNNSNHDDSWLISHGTHCAGIAAASSDNAIGVAGVSWGSSLMGVKVLNAFGGGTETDIAEGIVWAADHGATVGSLSLGLPTSTGLLEDAVNYAWDAGMVVVAATGNTPGAAVFYPARLDHVIAVGATDNRDVVASFTTTGPELDVSAPGVDVMSAYDTLFQANTYILQSGTSMACPHVSGLAALVKSANPALDNSQIRAIIESTCDDKGPSGWDPTYGHGRINARAAVEAAMALACLADCEGDGDLDAFDYLCFLGRFAAQDPYADWEGDGDWDVFDFLAFQSDFAAGC